MKDIKNVKKPVNAEINKLQKLHIDFESQIKKRLSKLETKSFQLLQENELRQSEELFRTTFNHAAVGIAHVNLKDGRWIRVNNRFCDIAGWPEEELLKQTFLDTTHPDDHKKDLQLIDDVLRRKVASISMEKRYVRKDGSIRWVYATASVIRGQQGKPKYGIAIVEDIHEKKRGEEMLKILSESSKLLGESLDYKQTLSSVVNLLVPQVADWCTIDLLDENNTFQRVNVGHIATAQAKEIADELYKYPPKAGSKSFIGKAIRSGKSVLIEKIDPKKMFQYVNNKKHLEVILRLNQKSFMIVPLIARGKIIGAITFLSTQDSRYYSSVDLIFAEQIANRIALAVDNSSLYYKEQKAVQIRDDFLAIVSHELKSSLTTIKALAQILERDSAKQGSDRSLTLFNKMDTQLNRTTKLINDLLDVGKIHTGKFSMIKELLDVDLLVKEVVENCQRFSPRHKIVVQGQTNEKIYADRDRIHQVLINLITNAIKYSLDALDIVVTLKKDKKNVIVAVQDFGIGIEKDKKQKIFERFFRADSQLRERTSGLGLGLFISHELVKQHGGSISVESQVGKGSIFSVVFPLSNHKQKKS